MVDCDADTRLSQKPGRPAAEMDVSVVLRQLVCPDCQEPELLSQLESDERCTRSAIVDPDTSSVQVYTIPLEMDGVDPVPAMRVSVPETYL